MNQILIWSPTVVGLAILGLIFQSYRNDKPEWALDFKAFSTKLKGYWTPLFLLVAPLAFVYNVLATAAYAVLVLFEWLVALVRWLIGLVLWIWNKGFLWYWRNVIVIPVVLIARLLWHYVVVWPWRIYKVAYDEIKGSFGRPGMRIGWLSMSLVLAILGTGWWGATLSGQEAVLFLSILLAEVPYLWGLGVLASMREQGGTADVDMEKHRAVGLKTARLGMKYVAGAAAVLLVVYLVAYSGAIPVAGYVVMGVLLNVAHLATAIGIGVLAVLTLSLAVLPSYVMDGGDEPALEEMLSLIRRGLDSVLKVFVGAVPASLFGVVVGLVPILVAVGAFAGTMALKEAALDNMAGVVAERAAEVEATLNDDAAEFAQWSAAISDQPEVQRRAAQIDYLTAFPMNLIDAPEEAMMGVSTVDYSSMAEELKMAYAARQTARDDRMASLEAEAAELRDAVALEESEKSTYTVERSGDGGETWSVVAQGVERSGYVDNGLAAGEAYLYRVSASNRKGDSGPGNTSMAFTRSAEIVGPASIRARAEGNFRVVLNWNDRDWNEDGFTVERQVGEGEWETLVNLPANSTTYVDESVQDKEYAYRVNAYRAGEESEPVQTWRKVRPSLVAPRSSVSGTNSSSALVVWSHDAAYRTVARGGESIDGDGAGLRFDGVSRLEYLQARLAEVLDAMDDLEAESEADAEAVRPRVGLLESLPAQEEADKPLRIVAFLLGMWALALLAGGGMSTLMVYTGRLNQALVRMNDGGNYRFVEEVRAVRKENDNQPLLGFLLLAITGPTVIPMLLGWLMSMLIVIGGGIALPLDGLALSRLDLDDVFELPDFSMEMEDTAEMMMEDTMEMEVPEETEPPTYTIQGGSSVWGEIADVFGANQYDAIRKANAHLSENEWRALTSGAVILLPEEME